jgi:hypothetical protein
MTLDQDLELDLEDTERVLAGQAYITICNFIDLLERCIDISELLIVEYHPKKKTNPKVKKNESKRKSSKSTRNIRKETNS